MWFVLLSVVFDVTQWGVPLRAGEKGLYGKTSIIAGSLQDPWLQGPERKIR